MNVKRAVGVLVAGLVTALGGCNGTSAGTCSSTATDTWSNYGQSFFSTNCTRCHSQFGSQSNVVNEVSAIEQAISNGNMPEGGSLGSEDKTRILNYLACGAP